MTRKLIMQKPIWGWGTGSSTDVYAALIGGGQLHWDVTTAHNMLLHSLFEQGMIGTALLLVALGALLVGCVRDPSPTRDVLLIWLLVQSFTEAVVQYPGVPLLLVAGSAASLNYPRIADYQALLGDGPAESSPMVVGRARMWRGR